MKEITLEELLLLSIEKLKLTDTAKEAFKNRNITIVAQLLFIHKDVLLAVPEIGQKTIKELNKILARHGTAEVGALANIAFEDIKTAILGEPKPQKAIMRHFPEPPAAQRSRQTATREQAIDATQKYMDRITVLLASLQPEQDFDKPAPPLAFG